MLRIAICDDNSTFIKHFHQLLEQTLKGKELSFKIIDYIRTDLLIDKHMNNPYDVVFLDIDMPQMNGFIVARQLTEKNSNCYIIFITNHNELVYDSFMFRPLNFIVKSEDMIMSNRLNMVIDQLKEQLKQDEIIYVENKDVGRVSFLLKDIIYIESDDHNVKFYLRDKKEPIIDRATMKELEDKFADAHFIRIHRKFIVNLKYVASVNNTQETIRLKTGKGIPMSRNYKVIVDQKLTEYLRKRG